MAIGGLFIFMNNSIFLVGPTGVGKTEVALILASKINAEIVSCDSMQVYCGMDIATAKPTKQEQREIPHSMIDIVPVTEEYDVARYVCNAKKAIAVIKEHNKIPLVVGGTGLYVKALVDGLFSGPEKDRKLRNDLEERCQKNGVGELYQELQKIDKDAAKKINIQDKRRIIRALEVYYLTGKPISILQREWGKEGADQESYCLVGLNRARSDLYERINERVEKMFAQGIVAETEELLQHGLRQNRVAFQALGYKEICEFLDGKCTLEETKEKLKQKSRNFAKRQLTWFCKDDRVNWFSIAKDEKPEVTVEMILEFLNKNVLP